MSLFQRAWAGLNLSPAERAFLKLLEGFILAGIVAALPAVAELLSAGTVDWATVGRTALGTFAVAVLMAAVKYCKAHGDSPLSEPLGQVLSGVATQIGNATGLNEPKQDVTLPDTPTVSIAPSPSNTTNVVYVPSETDNITYTLPSEAPVLPAMTTTSIEPGKGAVGSGSITV